MATKKESWSSPIGVVLSVAGSAVGLGNFLRFPGLAAQYGGGAFMIAYFTAFILIGLPLCWAEWAMGRYAGEHGGHGFPGALTAIFRTRWAKYLGVIGVTILTIAFTYYVYIESWCFGYAFNFFRNEMQFQSPEEANLFFSNFVGTSQNGAAIGFGLKQVIPYLLIILVINFYLLYRGLINGLEKFATRSVPTLIVIASIVLVRVLTLGTPDPEKPERNIYNGLGYMWNPSKVVFERQTYQEIDPWRTVTPWISPSEIPAFEEIADQEKEIFRVREITLGEQLLNPQLWLAAASQCFFSLCVGFGVIMCFASYMKKDDDVVLSGLAAASANEFCEVGLGGFLTIPAAVAYLGVAGIAGMGTFELGFHILPIVFSSMPGGFLFGGLFFGLLVLAAMAGSLVMLQLSAVFLEEALDITRKETMPILAVISGIGCFLVVYLSKDLKALDTLDFWVGNFLIFLTGTLLSILFAWKLGSKKILKEAHRGAGVKIPKIFGWALQYVSPVLLLLIFSLWLLINVGGYQFDDHTKHTASYIKDLFIEPNLAAWISIGWVLALMSLYALIASKASLYKKMHTTRNRR